jgi:hypothetical protein
MINSRFETLTGLRKIIHDIIALVTTQTVVQFALPSVWDGRSPACFTIKRLCRFIPGEHAHQSIWLSHG